MYTVYKTKEGKVMASKLTKVKEIVMPSCIIKDKGKYKCLILEIETDGGYTLRPKGTRRGGEAEMAGSFSSEYYKKIWAKAGL